MPISSHLLDGPWTRDVSSLSPALFLACVLDGHWTRVVTLSPTLSAGWPLTYVVGIPVSSPISIS